MAVPRIETGIARALGPQRLDLCYEIRGDPAAPVALLIMGFATQMTGWPEGFLQALVARGLRVLRFDNRDCGLSTHLTGRPDLGALFRGDTGSLVYRLADMADDAAALLGHLGIARAHAVGASMGGQIAQELALRHPERVLSLTSIMSSTGAPGVGQPPPGVLMQVFAGPPVKDRAGAVARALRLAPILRSPRWPPDPAAVAAEAGADYDRDPDQTGALRQMAAAMAGGDRTERLARLDLPTLVIHGLEDRLVPPSGGEATAAAIPGARLRLFDGMAHDLPAPLWPDIAGAIAALAG